MPKMDLSNNEEEQEDVKHEVAEVSNSTEIVPEEEYDSPALGQISGERDDKDYSWPKINLVQGVGALSEEYSPGTLLYEKQIPLLVPKKSDTGPDSVTDGSLEVTVLNALKRYQKYVPFGSDEPTEVVDTKREVEARGGVTEWIDNVPPTWTPFAQILFLFKCPSPELEAACPYEFEDARYGMALFRVQKTSYSVFQTISTASDWRLKKGLHLGKWQLDASRVRAGENMIWKPALKGAGMHDAAFVQWLSEIM